MKKILLIEDDAFFLDIYINKFEAAGYQVDVVGDGRLGLERVRSNRPDVILLDIVTPAINGFQVLKELKRDDEFKKIPIIIFSNWGVHEDVEKAKELGADGYLVKGQYTPSEVVAEVGKILDER